MSRPLIVIVEDDAVIAELLEFNLQNEGYATRSYHDGAALFLALQDESFGSPALFILDIMLPGMDGFEICATLKKNILYDWTPIMMLTARGTESDKVRGLEIGADDYLTKPFGMREFMARVQALIRRYRKLASLRQTDATADRPGSDQSAPDGDSDNLAELTEGIAERIMRQAESLDPVTRPGLIACQDIVVDDTRHRVFKANQEVEMTNREYELLKFLMLHRGVAYSRDDLLNHVWGYEYSGETRTVDVHIRQLRRKLEADDANPVLIETVRGRGYRFCED